MLILTTYYLQAWLRMVSNAPDSWDEPEALRCIADVRCIVHYIVHYMVHYIVHYMVHYMVHYTVHYVVHYIVEGAGGAALYGRCDLLPCCACVTHGPCASCRGGGGIRRIDHYEAFPDHVGAMSNALCNAQVLRRPSTSRYTWLLLPKGSAAALRSWRRDATRRAPPAAAELRAAAAALQRRWRLRTRAAQADRQADRQAGRQTDRQASRPTPGRAATRVSRPGAAGGTD